MKRGNEMSNIYLELMKKEISPALGCTEPGAIGLAVAKSHEILEIGRAHV